MGERLLAVRFLILHGYQGNSPEHWQRWLARRLAADGHDVAYPDLPDADRPQLEAWLEALAGERRRGDIVVCHSLACVLWLHHRARGGPPARRALLVAPPCPDAGIPEIAGFFPVPRTPALAEGAELVCSDADPYCPVGAPTYYGAPLAVPCAVVERGGHLNVDAGFGPWPTALAWCYGAKNGVDA
jgi:predicted alpha/beta hydrolase family esterase